LAEGKPIELIESKAFDEADARQVAESWAKTTGAQFTEIKVQFLEV
jgi:hypothetical protein